MNSITTRQNELLQLQRLSAQRELYSSAKRFYWVQMFFNVIVAITVSIISLFKDEFAPYAAAIGTLSILLDIFLLERMIKVRREKAAKIQELFDCDVLELPTSPLKVVSDVMVEEIIEQYNVHKKIESNLEKIKDWYPNNISGVPIHIARIICQRANCWWDAKLRYRYLYTLIVIGAVAILSLIVIGVIKNTSLLKFFLIANAIAPLFQFIIKQFYENRDGMERLKEIRRFAEETWLQAKEGKPVNEITENSRRIQDEIFTHRSQNPLIPDLLYNIFRDGDDKLMNISAETMIRQFSN